MAADKITWEQFMICNNEAQGINLRFEDLCRQLFENEFLAENKICRHVHCNPNNAGLEADPVYDENNQRYIGYQAKFFGDRISYSDIKDSAEKIIKYYAGKVDHVVLFCNKIVSLKNEKFNETVRMLNEAHISIELISDVSVLDMVRKYPYLGVYYFKNHSLNIGWFYKHTDEIKSKLGERYNENLNVDTIAARYLSLFVRDEKAVVYCNDKKKNLIHRIDELQKKSKEFGRCLTVMNKEVSEIAEVKMDTIEEALQWEQRIVDRIKDEIDELEKRRVEIQKRLKDLYEEQRAQGTGGTGKTKEEHEKRYIELQDKISYLENEIRVLDEICGLPSELNISKDEKNVLQRKVLFVEGKAGCGKSHMLANETIELLKDGRFALLLLGGDYLDSCTIHEQIIKNLRVDCSLEELLDILEVWGSLNRCIVPIAIDALNETWHKELWMTGLPNLLCKINTMQYVRMVVTYREEYRRLIIEEENISKYSVCMIKHNGFKDNSFEAVKKFMNHYGIPFSPVLFFNTNISNPLFLTLYCKTYQGDDVGLVVLYDRIIKCANQNIHKNLVNVIREKGYDATEDLVSPIISGIADFVLQTGRKSLSQKEISGLSVWEEYQLPSKTFITQLIRENILHDYVYDDETRLYFAYDQMNDFYCAKRIVQSIKSKDGIREYLVKEVLGISDGRITNYGNRDLFINVCAAYALKFNEECIDIIDAIANEWERRSLFENYIESLQWRQCDSLSFDFLLGLCKKYSPDIVVFWGMLITNSVKRNHPLNAEALHKYLMEQSLCWRDCIWTTYINELGDDNEQRLVQLISMYNEGQYLEGAVMEQLERLLVLFCWCLTSTNRWFRDITSKAMIEVLREHFGLCENLLGRFNMVNDPYVIQRLYGVVFGACVKRKTEQKTLYKSLVDYVYSNIFAQEMVYADILLRDYARLIIERYFLEYPEERDKYDCKKIIPPYRSEVIPPIEDQGYSSKDYSGGTYSIIRSMKFEGMGLYGDFGRYVFQAALRDFDVNQPAIFNYAMYFILNDLGYDEKILGDYDKSIGRYGYSRQSVAKVERIGKKYQWIAMYNILARVSDHCAMIERFSSEKGNLQFEGAWNPFVRDFDPTLNEYFVYCADAPVFESVQQHMEDAERKNIVIKPEEDWLNNEDEFFDYQKEDLILEGSDGEKWIVLTKYSDIGRDNLATNKLMKWFWLYGYFVTEDQLNTLKKATEKKISLLNNDITWIPETYSLFNREFPWAPSCKAFNEWAWKDVEVKTGEKKTVTHTWEVPNFSNVDELLKEYNGKDSDSEEVTEGVTTLTIPFKRETITREEEVTENIGKILSAAVDLRWEAEYDCSKEEAIVCRVPCAEIINKLKLLQKQYDGYFYDVSGNLVAFDSSLIKQKAGIVIRKDYLDAFLNKMNMRLVWIVQGAKEIHSWNRSIEEWSDWTGLLIYDGKQVDGTFFKVERQD